MSEPVVLDDETDELHGQIEEDDDDVVVDPIVGLASQTEEDCGTVETGTEPLSAGCAQSVQKPNIPCNKTINRTPNNFMQHFLYI